MLRLVGRLRPNPSLKLTIRAATRPGVAGRVDVHHPCEGHIKTQFQVVLPAEYHPFERMQEFVATVFEALDIPSDETFEALFVSPEQQTGYENATDREGMSDRMY